MAEIHFKATRRRDSGYRVLEKSGDLQFDGDPNSRDGIWLTHSNGDRTMIDCNGKTGVFSIKFVDSNFEVQE